MTGTKWRIIDIVVVLGIYAVVMTIFYAIIASIFGPEEFDELSFSPSFSLLEGVVESAILVFLPILIVTNIYNVHVREIGLTNIISITAVRAGLICGVTLWAVASIVDLIVESIFGAGPNHPALEQLKTAGIVGYVVLLIPILVLAPIAEEIYIRGFVYTILRERFGIVAGVVISSLLFAAFHMSPWFFLQTFVVAIGLAWLREKYSSVGPAIVAHTTVNLLAITIGSL